MERPRPGGFSLLASTVWPEHDGDTCSDRKQAKGKNELLASLRPGMTTIRR